LKRLDVVDPDLHKGGFADGVREASLNCSTGPESVDPLTRQENSRW